MVTTNYKVHAQCVELAKNSASGSNQSGTAFTQGFIRVGGECGKRKV